MLIICLHTVKWFQELLLNISNSIYQVFLWDINDLYSIVKSQGNNNYSECSKLAQREYKAKHDWVGKVIHWEMCKKFKFDHSNKWYMHNPAPVLKNDTHKLLWDFDIHTDHLISARKPDLIIIKKKKKKEKKKEDSLQKCRLCCPGWPQNKTERMWKEG